MVVIHEVIRRRDPQPLCSFIIKTIKFHMEVKFLSEHGRPCRTDREVDGMSFVGEYLKQPLGIDRAAGSRDCKHKWLHFCPT